MGCFSLWEDVWGTYVTVPVTVSKSFQMWCLSEFIKGVLIMFMDCLRDFMLFYAIDSIAMVATILT